MNDWLRPGRIVLNLPICLGLACASDPGGGFPGVESASDGASSGGSTALTAEDPPDVLTTTSDEPGEADTTPTTTSSTSQGATSEDTTSEGATTEQATSGGAMPPGSTSEASTGEPDGAMSTSTTDGPGEPMPDPGQQDDKPVPPANATDPNLLVAFVGDQGSGSDTKAVYQLIKDEGADFLIILGDFDYGDDPDGWAEEMDGVLGDSYPVFGAIGNHDVDAWSGYQGKLKDRLEKIQGATCDGDLGVKSGCKYRGLHFILSGIGTKGSDSAHEDDIGQRLAADDSLWSLCVWHKNMRDMQAGDKPDEITWKAMQLCQEDGSIVVMGHEHSYARTKTLTDVGNKAAGHGATGMPELVEVGAGSTFSAVSGLGGKGIRAYEPDLHDDDTWWATLYTSNYHLRNGVEVKDFDADSGVMFIRFHVDGDPNAAHGYFKNIKGQLIDEFDIVRK